MITNSNLMFDIYIDCVSTDLDPECFYFEAEQEMYWLGRCGLEIISVLIHLQQHMQHETSMSNSVKIRLKCEFVTLTLLFYSGSKLFPLTTEL